MTIYTYPRLSTGLAGALIQQILETFEGNGLSGVARLAANTHPKADPIATGGRVADAERIQAVRDHVLNAVNPWLGSQQPLSRSSASEFDLALGKALHSTLEIVPSDAASVETWNFLTLVVLPEVGAYRFPDLHPSRMTGVPRNVLRRTWLRHEVIGDMLEAASKPLGEDELVGLFERTALSRNRPLIRRLARAIMNYEGQTSRSEWVRDLLKNVTYATGPRLLDGLSNDELDELIAASMPKAEPDVAHDLVANPDPKPREITLGDPAGSLPLQSANAPQREGVLEEQLRETLLSVYRNCAQELGHAPTALARLLSEEGPVTTAVSFVMAENPSGTFVKLWERGRTDLSVEAVVISPQFTPLFSDVVRARAQQRLSGIRAR